MMAGVVFYNTGGVGKKNVKSFLQTKHVSASRLPLLKTYNKANW